MRSVPETDGVQRIAFALEALIREMVDEPDLFHLETATDANGSVVFRVIAASSDVGRLIGMQGRTARSLRVILGALSFKTGKNLSLDIKGRIPN